MDLEAFKMMGGFVMIIATKVVIALHDNGTTVKNTIDMFVTNIIIGEVSIPLPDNKTTVIKRTKTFALVTIIDARASVALHDNGTTVKMIDNFVLIIDIKVGIALHINSTTTAEMIGTFSSVG